MMSNVFDKFWYFLHVTHGSNLLIGLDAEAERTGRKRKERGERGRKGRIGSEGGGIMQ